MEKTTTKKIKRTIELDSIKKILEENKIKIKDFTGKNIDAIKHLILPEKPALTANPSVSDKSTADKGDQPADSDSK